MHIQFKLLEGSSWREVGSPVVSVSMIVNLLVLVLRP